MPAVVLTGARQTGKSTLAEHLARGRRRYRSLDDLDVLDAAPADAGDEPASMFFAFGRFWGSGFAPDPETLGRAQ